ncbi:hypothetical protein V5P93_006746 [Actinokineospora auranticolor]|uniref:Uncharacterized protein n=1 Tax=Actinokineospora auranticolor TaxID=155976 RepID=A0A2S6GWQ6_9PSEU|nr:hypothetical protein [Actinokineospora auranticolor]PPK69610.1 hypothetical protein CLV40_103220 [Actinokineospora auranticolor]
MSDHDRATRWAAAFGAQPGESPGPNGSDPAGRWLAAVALGGQGRYAAATALLEPVISGALRADPATVALAASTLASHRRQLGGHAAARRLDGAGLRALAEAGALTGGAGPLDHRGALGEEGADLAAARSDVLLGLAADAVGLGRPGEARRLFGIESAWVDAGWRARIRRGWVAAEIALAAGDPAAAVDPAEAAAEAAEGCGSVRHRAKSALVLGAVRAATGDPAAAHRLITGCLRESVEHGLLPLRWAGALVLADLAPGVAAEHRSRAERVLHCVLRHSDPAGRALALASPWLPTSGFGLGPNR